MKWVPDQTGRFESRPHFTPDELDVECEQVIEDVLLKRHGKVLYPISTEDLLYLLEREAWVDQYVDLESEDGEVWGETEFGTGAKPQVRILRRLSEDERYANPFRTTLTHEFAHVHYHGFLFAAPRSSGNLFGPVASPTRACKREQIEGHRKPDWMEWQANYSSGALLMPKTALRGLVRHFLRQNAIVSSAIGPKSAAGTRLITAVSQAFQVSQVAASVRLSQMRFLHEGYEKQSGLLT